MKIMKKTTTIEIVNKESAPLIKEGQSFKITSPEDMSKSAELLSRCNRYLDSLTLEKEKVTKPLNEALKEVRGRYKPVETALTSTIAALRSEQSRYQTEQVRIQREAEAKIAARVKEGKGNLKIETAVKKLAEVDRPEVVVATESGALKFRTSQVLKVVDLAKIPKSYFDLNESRLTKDLKAGKTIPGAELEEVQTPVNYR